MSDKRLLFITTVPQTIKAFLLPFATYFRNNGWQVDAMASNIGDFPEVTACFDKTWDVKFSRNPLNPSNLFSALQTVRNVISQEKYDVVHVHTPVAAFVVRFALRNIKSNRPKVIYTAHGFHFFAGNNLIKNAIFLLLEKLAGRWTDCLIVINQEDKLAAEKFNLVPIHRVCYMPGIGIDLDKYSSGTIAENDILSLRRELRLAAEDKFFLMIAEFTPQKNHRFLLEAFHQLNHKGMHLVFAGCGSTLKEMQDLTGKLGLSDRVHFLGFRSDIATLISASVAVLLVSHREGLPRSIMEAMSLGRLVIGTDIRGVRDLLQGGAGMLIPSNDVKALAEAMKDSLDSNNKAHIDKMIHEARMRVAKYDLKKIIELHSYLYEQVFTVNSECVNKHCSELG
jgi:glycosyltransferase involved in cell wall biosynthesis